MANEKRLIDANAKELIERINRNFGGVTRYIIKSILKDAPTVIAEVHGQWVHCNGKSNLWYCSVCGEKILYNPTRRTYNIEKRPVYEVNKHCRCCGAKMDGGNEDG